jgi:hypothetical protein
MNCTTAQNHWHAQQDGELSIEQQAALTSHLTGCAVCRAYIADLEAVTGALAELRDASSHIGETVTAGSPHRTGWRRHLRGMNLRGGRIAATIALVLGAGLVTWRSLPPESSRELGSPVPTALPPQARTGRLARRQRRRIHPGRTIHAATPRSPVCFVQFGGIYRSRYGLTARNRRRAERPAAHKEKPDEDSNLACVAGDWCLRFAGIGG